MVSKRLSLVQVNFAQGPRELNAFYLPYSVGCIWSHALSRRSMAENWQLSDIIWKRDSIDAISRNLCDCDVIGFSSYVWNRNYNNHLAAEIKKLNPNALIVFGGPDPPITDPLFFERFPYIDIVVKNEGENAFADMLENVNGDLSSIPGLLVNDNGALVDTGNSVRLSTLENISSPYSSGIFDKLVSDNPDVTWNATLETNRGCPYQCTFCDWGSLTYSKVKNFNLDRVFNDIEWIGRNRCDWMSIADANFGMFVDRDSLIVDKIIETQSRYGYPRRIGLSWAKNQKSQVIDLARKLMDNGFSNGLTLSVQSLDDGVLDTIKRRNLEVPKLKEVFEACNRKSVAVNTELILGLPGETVGSWKENVWKLMDLNQHNGIEFFQAQLLENAEMNTSQRYTHGIRSITVYDYLSGTDDYDELPEGVDVVTSTNDLDSNQMLECQEFQWFINTWHISGISQWHSRYVNRKLGVPYGEFYEGFARYLSNVDWYESERRMVLSAYSNWMETGKIDVKPVAGVDIHGWNLIHLTNLRMHASASHQIYHDAIGSYVRDAYGSKLSDGEMDVLDSFGQFYVIKHHGIRSYPMEVKTGFNMIGYLLGDGLINGGHTHRFVFNEDPGMSLSVFMQNIYYARRRNFGKARISGI